MNLGHDPMVNAMGVVFVVVPLFVQAFADGLLVVGAWKEIKVLLGIWLVFAILGQAWLGWMSFICFMARPLEAKLILFGIIGLVIFAFICFAIFVVIKNLKLIMKNQIESDAQPLNESCM